MKFRTLRFRWMSAQGRSVYAVNRLLGAWIYLFRSRYLTERRAAIRIINKATLAVLHDRVGSK